MKIFAIFLHQLKAESILTEETFGHSLIISPDGKIIKGLNNNKEGIITATIDPTLPKKLRNIIPSLNKN